MYLYDEGESVLLLLLFRIGVKLLHFLSKGHLLEFLHHSKELKSRSSNDIHSYVETMTQAKELVWDWEQGYKVWLRLHLRGISLAQI